MNRRAHNRRTQRAADKGDLPANMSHGKKNGRGTPSDHPDRAAEPLESSKYVGMRMISVVDRSGVLPAVGKLFTGRRGKKTAITYRALLVAMLLAMYTNGRSYTRADVCAAIPGMKPTVARKLGVLDDDGQWHIPKYKSVCWMIKRLERKLRWGWDYESTRCDLAWFAASLIRASVPRKIRRSVDTIVIDGTAVEAFGCTKQFTKQKELERDAYANYRKASLENPQMPEPEQKKELLAAEAKKKGLRVGPDGRIIRGADEDARVGWRTATNSQPGKYYVGYELTAAVAAQSVIWNGKNAKKFKLGPEVPRYILSISMNPAGNNPGPAGVETVRAARMVAPKVNRVVADRGFTLKRETFLRVLHKEKIDVVMDYKKAVVDNHTPAVIGQRRESVFMHCGTILPRWMPKYWRKPPTELLGDGKKLTDWYNRRAALYRFSFKGWLKGGGMKLQCPQCAGRVGSGTATAASGSYSKPLRSVPPAGECCGGQVNAAPIEVDQFQKLPYGTQIWVKAYKAPRAVVEGVFSAMKTKGGLSKGTCQALGLAANTVAATLAAVAHNIREAKAHGVTDDDYNDCGRGGDDGRADMAPATGNPATVDDSPRRAPDRAPPPT